MVIVPGGVGFVSCQHDPDDAEHLFLLGYGYDGFDSGRIHLRRLDPLLVIRPVHSFSPDWCSDGTRPARAVSLPGSGKRFPSPISLSMIVAE